jgi:hypothetical protein
MPKSYKAFIKEYSMGLQVPSTSYLKGVGSLNKGGPLRKKEDVGGSLNIGRSLKKKEDVVPVPALTNATPLKKRETFKNKMGMINSKRISKLEK